MRVFVTDGDNRATLAVTRSLGAAGHDVVVGEKRTPALAQTSRYCSERVCYPDPVRQSDSFIAFLIDFVREQQIEVLLPVSDIATFLVTEHRDQFDPGCAIPFASAANVAAAADKVGLHETARRLGVPVPHGVTVHDPHTVPAVPFEFPVVIKPWKSRVRTAHGWRSSAVSYARDRGELVHDIASRAAHEFPLMIQERIVGPGQGVFACFHHGTPIAVFAHRRVLERPPWGGVSVISESVPVDPTAETFALRLLSDLSWHGVAMVEFKQDLRDGQPKLMEINGRFWGSLQLAIDSGVDFPSLLVEQTRRVEPRPQPPYQVGTRTRWLWGTVDSLMLTLLRFGREPHRVPGGRRRVVGEFLKFWGPHLHYDNPKWGDLGPFLHETRARLMPTPADDSPAGPLSAGASVTAAPTASAGVRTTVATTLDGTGLDATAWNALAATSATNSIFQTHQWSTSWWSSFGDQFTPRFVSATDDTGVVGVAPLILDSSTRQRVLRFLGDGRADYCDFLTKDADIGVLLRLFAAVTELPDWDVILLNNLPGQSPTVDALTTWCARAGLPTLVNRHVLCPTLLIDGHQDEARAVLNKPSLRRPLHYFQRSGRLDVRDLRRSAAIEPLLDAFFAQHVTRRLAKHSRSLFDEPRNRTFYRALTRNLDGTDWLLFSVATVDERPIAIHFGFDYNGVVTWYKPAFDVTAAHHSPGLLMVRHLLQYACEGRRRELDFTVGDEPFKQRFTNALRHNVRLMVFKDQRQRMAELWRRRLRSIGRVRWKP